MNANEAREIADKAPKTNHVDKLLEDVMKFITSDASMGKYAIMYPPHYVGLCEESSKAFPDVLIKLRELGFKVEEEQKTSYNNPSAVISWRHTKEQQKP